VRQFNDATCAMCDRRYSVKYYAFVCYDRRLEPDCVPSYYAVRMRTEVCQATFVHRNRLCPDHQSVLPSAHRGRTRGHRDQVSKKPRTRAEKLLQKCGGFAGFVIVYFCVKNIL